MRVSTSRELLLVLVGGGCERRSISSTKQAKAPSLTPPPLHVIAQEGEIAAAPPGGDF